MANGGPVGNDMIQRILAAKGGADTPANVMAIKNFIGSNPEMAERYAMGMPQDQTRGDSMDTLQLDKMLAQADDTPPGRVEVGDPQFAGKKVQQQQVAPPQQPQRRGGQGYGGPDPVGISPQPPTGELTDGIGKPAGDSGGWGWLTALLGASAAGAAGAKAVPRTNRNPSAQERIEGANPQQKRIGYTPKLEDNVSDLSRVPTNEPAPTQVRNSPELEQAGKTAQLQSEVNSENAASEALMQQMRQRQQAQQETAKLAQAARRAVGRR